MKNGVFIIIVVFEYKEDKQHLLENTTAMETAIMVPEPEI